MYKDLKGKNALITGAGKKAGIGYAVAKKLAACGVNVALADLATAEKNDPLLTSNKAQLARLTQTLGETCKVQTLALDLDVTRSESVQNMAAVLAEEFNNIHILFNNAGVIHRKDIIELEEAQWDLVVDVSLKAIFLLSRCVIPVMTENGGGSIINTGSGWGLKGGPQAAAYCAAKGGVVNLTRAMAIDHGKQGIRVNCVCPGDIDTPLLRGEARQLGVNEEEFMKESAERPINRVGTPEDVARAVLFLAGNLSGWVTGTSIVVDGGGLA